MCFSASIEDWQLTFLLKIPIIYVHILNTLFCPSVCRSCQKRQKPYCWGNVIFSTDILDRQLQCLVKIFLKTFLVNDIKYCLLFYCLTSLNNCNHSILNGGCKEEDQINFIAVTNPHPTPLPSIKKSYGMGVIFSR